MDRRRAGPGRRLAAELLRHPRRGRERVPALLARQRDPAALAHPRAVRAGRPRPGARAARRAQHRDRRRRPDRRRGRRRARRHDQGHRPGEYRNLDATKAHIHLLDYGDALLKPFSDKAHGYVAKVLDDKESRSTSAPASRRSGPGTRVFSDGTVIPTRCVVWGGGIKAAAVAADCGLAQGRGGRVDVQPDLTLAGTPASTSSATSPTSPAPTASRSRSSGSVALQSGAWAADNILAGFEGKTAQGLRATTTRGSWR